MIRVCTTVWEALSCQSVLDELLKRQMTALCCPSIALGVRGNLLADGLRRRFWRVLELSGLPTGGDLMRLAQGEGCCPRSSAPAGRAEAALPPTRG